MSRNWRRRKLAQACKALALAAVWTALVGALLFHRVRASIDRGLFQVGSEARSLSGEAYAPARSIQVNGIHVRVSSRGVAEPLEAVLERLRAACRGEGMRIGKFEVDLGGLAALSAQNETQGYVACLGLGAGPVSIEDLLARFERFARTGALHEIGDMRFAYAERVGRAPPQTFVFTMWSDAELNLSDLLPSSGTDAKGRDVSEVPRPPSSRRLLFASEHEAPSELAIYEVSAAPESLVAFYRKVLARGGWRVLGVPPSRQLRFGETRFVAAHRAGTTAALAIRPVSAESTMVTVLRGEEP